MPHDLYPHASAASASRKRRPAPGVEEAFHAFGQKIFADGALPEETTHPIAVAAAHVTQYPWSIRGPSRVLRRLGASPEETMEAVWVAAEIRTGGAFAHSTIALDEIEEAPAEDHR